MPRRVLDRLVRGFLGRVPSSTELAPVRGGPYRASAFEPHRGNEPRRIVAILPVRLLGAVLIGDLEVGLDGLRFVTLRGEARVGTLEAGRAGVGLGASARVEDPVADIRLDLGKNDDPDVKERHPTVRAVLALATSPGFVGQLDHRRHDERFLADAARRGWWDGESTYEDGFVALGADKVRFFGTDQHSWAAAAARELPYLGCMDSRSALLRAAMAWLSDAAFAAALERTPGHLMDTYDRAAVRAGERLPDGRLRVGDLDLRLSEKEERTLAEWLGPAG